MNSTSNAVKLAQSASALGAGLLGFAIGAKWGAGIGSTVLMVILVAGALIHVGGMYVMQMKDPRRSGKIAKLLWITAWICLLALAGLFIYLAVE
jgi:hypothetical protein